MTDPVIFIAYIVPKQDTRMIKGIGKKQRLMLVQSNNFLQKK
jgi:hypothetical protein